MAGVPLTASEPLEGDERVAATEDLNKRPWQRRKQLDDCLGVPEVVEDGAVEVVRDAHHRCVGRSTQGLGELPTVKPDDSKERILDRVLRDQTKFKRVRQRLSDGRLPRR